MRFVKGFFCLSCLLLSLAANASGQSAATTVKTTADVASSFKNGDWPTYMTVIIEDVIVPSRRSLRPMSASFAQPGCFTAGMRGYWKLRPW